MKWRIFGSILIVILGYFDIDPQVVLNELARRQGLSGLVEKANRQPLRLALPVSEYHQNRPRPMSRPLPLITHVWANRLK